MKHFDTYFFCGLSCECANLFWSPLRLTFLWKKLDENMTFLNPLTVILLICAKSLSWGVVKREGKSKSVRKVSLNLWCWEKWNSSDKKKEKEKREEKNEKEKVMELSYENTKRNGVFQIIHGKWIKGMTYEHYI